MNNYQLDHNEYKHEKRKFPIYIVLDNVEDKVNIGSIFRIADAFGVSKIYICGNDNEVVDKKVKRISRNTTEYIDFEYFKTTDDCVSKLKNEGIKVIGLEITSQSVSVNLYDFNKNNKYAFVIGNEEKGVSQSVLNNVDGTVHVDMYGNNSSMNVAVSTGIAINDCLNKIK